SCFSIVDNFSPDCRHGNAVSNGSKIESRASHRSCGERARRAQAHDSSNRKECFTPRPSETKRAVAWGVCEMLRGVVVSLTPAQRVQRALYLVGRAAIDTLDPH